MTATEIRDICINSAEKYLEFLAENNKGKQEVEVYEISLLRGNEKIYKLRLAAKLFDLDSIFFKLHHNNRVYTVGEIKVVEYDADQNVLVVKPTGTLINDFERLRPVDIKVISDLTFLVARIKTWYELNGANVFIPIKHSDLKDLFEKIEYLSDSPVSPNQKAALKTLFENPFSYIWGAPGTGKTQFVLSYALLHYVRRSKRVAVLAPTNNALEQVLRGVLKMIDKAGIKRTKLIRLGTPSRKFAEEFPEVCEQKGVLKNLEQLDKQIEILKKVLIYERKRDGLDQAKSNIGLFSKLPAASKKLNEAQEYLIKSKQLRATCHSQMTMIEREILTTKRKQKKLQKKIKSLGTKIKKAFSKKPIKAELELAESENVLRELLGKQTYIGFDLKEKEADVKLKTETLEKTKANADSLLNLIKSKFLFLDSLSAICSELHLENCDDIKSRLDDKIDDEEESLQVEGGLFEGYQHHSADELKEILQKLETRRAKLAGGSTEERLQTVNVIACTLDGYVGRYTETKLRVDHIFMDEAGYSNMIKALTLFNHNVPITFLGDHKQLPPVCEINDFDIERNDEYTNIFLWAQSAIFLEGLFHKTRDEMLREYISNASLRHNKMMRADLNETYRFGSNLARILGKHVYNNGFISLNEKGDTELFYAHANKQEASKSRLSINEVISIRHLVEILNKNREEFVILTPYKKQVKLLGQHLPHERNELKILTVHGSQGREWDTVILSVVDTHDKWFVDSQMQLSKGLNLLNTALSRAKKRLIIVCDSRFESVK